MEFDYLGYYIEEYLLQDPTYILVLNLVISDLLLCGLILPFNIQSSLNREFSLGQSDYARCQSCQTIGALFVILRVVINLEGDYIVIA